MAADDPTRVAATLRECRTVDADGMRYALLRDILGKPMYPFGVLMETPDGRAKLLTYHRPPGALGLRQEYDDFEGALELLARSFLVTAVGREGQEHRV